MPISKVDVTPLIIAQMNQNIDKLTFKPSKILPKSIYKVKTWGSLSKGYVWKKTMPQRGLYMSCMGHNKI